MSIRPSPLSLRPTKTALIVICLGIISMLLLSACGGGTAKQNSAAKLVMGQVGDQYVNNFNPYAEASGGPPNTMIYESLPALS
ncbi:hypothetical protein KSF_095250 [Reticulibacter mediterranei]|uniref:Uncharacterized protein n=1 Tax=Reticulibacter mediterranei TaxID=2778369 RepID=A0A8J3IZ81_9CHLR|nr:hypothetical protein [Reticulibacter mediterranei]GHO99477.1 hypothetical protein KSF_095250 [Reticulibacter mediterranei]